MAIDGFRMDAVPYLYEDPGFLDEPRSNKTDDPNSYDYLEHIYTFNLPEVYEMIKDFNNVLSEYEIIDGFDRVVMVEALSDSLSTQELMKYYESCDFAFNFNFVVHLDPKSQSMASDIEFLIDDWMKNMPAGKTANWVVRFRLIIGKLHLNYLFCFLFLIISNTFLFKKSLITMIIQELDPNLVLNL